MTRFLPILLGSDINVYGMARAFHEAYGITSRAYAYFQLSPTKFSRIVDVHIVPDFNNFVTFRDTMLAEGKRLKQEDPDRALLLIPCGDVYANLLSQCGDDLKRYYVYNTLDIQLSRKLAYKSTFYRMCEQYGLPHPKTKTVTADQVKAGEYRDLPFDYPVAMKPANSVEWLNIDFEGRKKAYILDTPEQLETIIRRAYEAGYTSEMVIQDFIPGDDSHMRVLNAYVDKHHRVRMMFLGHPLLEDPSPVAVGNYAAIIPDYNEDVFRRIKAFLEAIEYEGVANFDMKYDERDGEYKLFEINCRQGRSNYYVTGAGYNIAKLLVEDRIEHRELPFVITKNHALWRMVPKKVAFKFIPKAYHPQMKALIRAGASTHSLEYHRDYTPARIWRVWKTHIGNMVRFDRHNKVPEN